MVLLRFGTKFPHFPQDSDALSIGIQFHQRAQRRFHGIGICVVAIVEKTHALNLFDLQTRFGKWRSNEASSAILEGKTKESTGGNCEQRILDHVQTRYWQLGPGTVRCLQDCKICPDLALSDFVGSDFPCSCY